jgi:hypothetical protein
MARDLHVCRLHGLMGLGSIGGIMMDTPHLNLPILFNRCYTFQKMILTLGRKHRDDRTRTQLIYTHKECLCLMETLLELYNVESPMTHHELWEDLVISLGRLFDLTDALGESSLDLSVVVTLKLCLTVIQFRIPKIYQDLLSFSHCGKVKNHGYPFKISANGH